MAPSRPRRVNQGCIRAICVLLAASALIFAALAGMKPRREALPAAEPQDPGPLASIFVCITFAWQVDKLGLLQLVRVSGFNAPRMGSAPLRAWCMGPNLAPCGLRLGKAYRCGVRRVVRPCSTSLCRSLALQSHQVMFGAANLSILRRSVCPVMLTTHIAGFGNDLVIVRLVRYIQSRR